MIARGIPAFRHHRSALQTPAQLPQTTSTISRPWCVPPVVSVLWADSRWGVTDLGSFVKVYKMQCF